MPVRDTCTTCSCAAILAPGQAPGAELVCFGCVLLALAGLCVYLYVCVWTACVSVAGSWR